MCGSSSAACHCTRNRERKSAPETGEKKFFQKKIATHKKQTRGTSARGRVCVYIQKERLCASEREGDTHTHTHTQTKPDESCHTYKWGPIHVHEYRPIYMCCNVWLNAYRLTHMNCERWGAGVETQKNVRGEAGGWGRVPCNEPTPRR